MTRRLFLALLLILGLATQATAQQQPSAELRAAAEQVVALLQGRATPPQVFTPSFLAAVPETQVATIVQQLGAQYGAARRIASIDAQSANSGTIHVETERATLHMNLVVEDAPPHRISGLLFTGADMRGDTMAAILEELRALPGDVSISVARLGEGSPAAMHGLEPERPGAIGSAFKLWVLAELSRQVQAGEREWSDTMNLDRRSFLGGTLYNWPQGAPVTLHTLAALMISVSDNTATDVLLHALGRENVERMMERIGIASAARNRPFLSTFEMASIKTGPTAGLNLWRQLDEEGRRRLLANEHAGRDGGEIDVSRFGGAPMALDVEWFASPADLVRTMDWLRRNADDTARAIMAINPAIDRRGFSYVGYKGGSEPGVINLTWLARTESGQWYAVAGTWNNPAAPVEEQRFLGLMRRAVQLLR